VVVGTAAVLILVAGVNKASFLLQVLYYC